MTPYAVTAPQAIPDEIEAGLPLPEALLKTIHHFAPDFLPALARIHDPRDPKRVTYPIQEVFLLVILVFVLKIGSRRNIKYKLGTPKFIENLKSIGEVFYPGTPFPDRLSHGDNINKILKRIPVSVSHELRKLVLYALIRSRALERWRILGSYAIAIDGTGVITYPRRHCPHCLTRRHANGSVTYYHPVLEAKLVCPGLGLALSIGTEFIENLHEAVDKQDCELKAFHRLIPKLRKDFPQLPICLLLDGIYANEGVFRRCAEQRVSYLITLKEGSMPATWTEYQALKNLAGDQRLRAEQGRLSQEFSWVNGIDYNGHTLNAVEMTETDGGRQKFFNVWLSSWFVTRDNVKGLAQGGRGRWIIENEGFNTQKNEGYELEHAFSTDGVAMKHFYILLQLAHIFDQLMGKGSLLRDRIRQTMGSLRVLWGRLWALMTETLLDAGHLRKVLAQRIQIRFDSG